MTAPATIGSPSIFYGTITTSDNTTTTDASQYRIRLQPDPTVPTIGLLQSGTTTEFEISLETVGGVESFIFGTGDPTVSPPAPTALMTVRSTAVNGSIVQISGLGTTTLTSTATRVLVSDAAGDMGGLTSLPINLGGTGLTAAPANNTLLGSNGTTFIPFSAGTGISITNTGASGTISASGSPQLNSVNIYNGPPTTSPMTATVPAISDKYMTTISFTAGTTAAGVTVGIFATSTDTTYNVVIETALRRPSTGAGGAGKQSFRVTNIAGTVTSNNYGSTDHNGLDPTISPTVSGTNVNLTMNTTTGDIWKCFLNIVKIGTGVNP